LIESLEARDALRAERKDPLSSGKFSSYGSRVDAWKIEQLAAASADYVVAAEAALDLYHGCFVDLARAGRHDALKRLEERWKAECAELDDDAL
jgi:hypothetical protein